MTGWWYPTSNKPEWSTMKPNMIMKFKHEDDDLIFSDKLSYGTLQFLPHDSKIIEKEINKIADDIMTSDSDIIIEKIKSLSNTKLLQHIEDAIMDQSLIVSGVGNYLKSEILYEAKISPLRKVKDISDDEWKNLLKIGKKFSKKMAKALSNGGYTESMKVYQRKEDPDGNKIEKHKSEKTKRTTFWVPAIQR